MIFEESIRLKVSEVAKILGVGAENIRVGILNGNYPFGTAVKTSTHYTYVIIRKKFYEYIGK